MDERHVVSGHAGERAHAAVAIVTAEAAGGSVLLLRRRECERDHWSGHWCFPGGRLHAEDPDLLATALRELREECGLVLPREALREELPLGRAGSPQRYLVVKPFVLAVPEPVPLVPHEAEMAEARWIPMQELRDPARHVVRSVPGQPPERLLPTFELGPVPLWGFTYRLACRLAGMPEIGPG